LLNFAFDYKRIFAECNTSFLTGESIPVICRQKPKKQGILAADIAIYRVKKLKLERFK
jgi:hypothetical protein